MPYLKILLELFGDVILELDAILLDVVVETFNFSSLVCIRDKVFCTYA